MLNMEASDALSRSLSLFLPASWNYYVPTVCLLDLTFNRAIRRARLLLVLLLGWRTIKVSLNGALRGSEHEDRDTRNVGPPI